MNQNAAVHNANKQYNSEEHAEAFRKWVEFQALEVIKEVSKKSDVTEKHIQDMAEKVLSLIKPDMDLEELFHNAIKLNEGFPEYDYLVVKLMKEYEQKYNKRAVEEVEHLVKSGQYDQAQDIIKKILEFKIEE